MEPKNPAEVETPEKIEFTPEQQEFINNTLIKDAMSRAGREARNEASRLKNEMAELKTQQDKAVAEFEKQLKEAQTRKAGESGEDVDAVRAEFERINVSLRTEAENLKKEAEKRAKEAEDARTDNMRLRKRYELTAAAQRSATFYDLDGVIKLTEDRAEWDEESGRFVIKGENGEIRRNATLEKMSLDEFYYEYATKNQWAVKGNIKGGVHSSENRGNGGPKVTIEEIFGPKSSAQKAMKLKKERPEDYRKLKQAAIEGGLIS